MPDVSDSQPPPSGPSLQPMAAGIASSGEATGGAWITKLAIAACIVLFLAINYFGPTRISLSNFGFVPSAEIWEGKYWGLITSAFIHIEIFHLVFNLVWLWSLGRLMENALGGIRYLAFLLVSAFVSSSVQIIVSDDGGIGASGMVYGLFGFMWLARFRYPAFQQVLTAKNIRIFLLWLVGCMVATYLKIWNVGNGAHVGGLIFGALVAWAFVLRQQRALAIAALAIMVSASIVLLLWCPWSVTWLAQHAYAAHSAGRYPEAMQRYTQLLELDPQNDWALENRGLLHLELGEPAKAKADTDAANQLKQEHSKQK